MKKLLLLITALFITITFVSCAREEPKIITPENAYEIAVRLGFHGSEEDWIKSLRGSDGEDGENGKNGANGSNGINGKDGIGIVDVYVDENGYLTVKFSDESTVIAGYVGIATEDTSTEPPVLNKTSLTIPEGMAYLLSADRPEVKYESSDTSIAQISADGLVVALSEGSAVVTATSKDGKTATCEISVVCYEYKKLSDGTLEITGYNGTSKNLVIPSEILDKTVSSIGNSAFADYFGENNITSVTVPDTVIRIESYAFVCCEKLTSVSFGNGLKSIGNSAFSGCILLDDITLPDSLEVIEGAAFNSCESLTSVSIPSGVSHLNGAAFANCSSLSSVSFGSLISIGHSAFEYCESLASITLPDTVKYIDEYAFSGCSLLSTVKIPAGASYFNNSFHDTPWFDIHQNDDLDTVLNDTVWTFEMEHLNLRTHPIISEETEAEIVEKGTELFRIGILYDNVENMTWAKVKYNGEIYYVSNKYLTTERPSPTA